jgi:hypothetical protein
VQQHGLGLIAGVVRHRHRLRATGAGYARKEAIARCARRRMQVHALRPRDRWHIGCLDRGGQTPIARQASNKHRLVGRLRAADHMIEMRDLQQNAQVSAQLG